MKWTTEGRAGVCLGAAALAGLLLAAGCAQQMSDQPRYEPLEASDLFADGQASREPVPGTVARGQLRPDEHFYAGTVNGVPAEALPLPVTRELLERGKDRYDIFCAPCHDRAGTGDGMVVQRGFRRPASLHVERLRNAPAGHFFDAISNGFGAMTSYATQVPPRDRWAIVAYIRALQLSQRARFDELPARDRDRLEALR